MRRSTHRLDQSFLFSKFDELIASKQSAVTHSFHSIFSSWTTSSLELSASAAIMGIITGKISTCVFWYCITRVGLTFRILIRCVFGTSRRWYILSPLDQTPQLACVLQAESLQQGLREEVADCWWTLHRASAHLLLQQDGDETGHDAGGERERPQAANSCVIRVNAVSVV